MMNRLTLLSFLALCLPAFLAGCNATDDPGSGDDLAFATLEYTNGTDVKGEASGIVGKRLQVVRDSDEFSTLWAEHVAVFAPMPAQPVVDFSTRMVVAVFSGRRPSGGYSATVTRIAEYEDFVDVVVELESPGDGCTTAAMVTHPHHMVTVPARDKPVVFTEVFTEAPAC